MRKKKLVSGILLATAMLVAACGKNTTNTDTAPIQDTEQATVEETNSVDAEEVSDDAGSDEANAFLERFADIEKQAEELKNSIDNDDLTQVEYNLKSNELYTLWDDTLNDLWTVLGKVLSKEEMEKLTKEEQDWIAMKEQKVTDAGKEVEGGSMQPMVEDLTGADLTEKRVRELLPYIQALSDTVPDGSASEDGTSDDNHSGNTEQQNDLFFEFLENGGKTNIADDFHQDDRQIEFNCSPGETFDLASLKDELQNNEVLSGVEPEMEYAVLNHPNRKAYALSLYYNTSTEGFTQFFILSEKDGQLEINFLIDGWSRRYPSINENGVIFDSGSNGAASHSVITYVPDSDFEYKVLCETTENGYGYSFYDAEGAPVQALNDIMTEAGDGNPDAMSVFYNQAVIDGKTYYYYLDSEEITQELVDYIDGIAEDHGFTFDGKDAVSAAELAYAKKLGVEEIYDNEKRADWTEINE